MVRARFSIDRMKKLADLDFRIAQVANGIKMQFPNASDKEILLHVYNAYVKPNREIMNKYNSL